VLGEEAVMHTGREMPAASAKHYASELNVAVPDNESISQKVQRLLAITSRVVQRAKAVEDAVTVGKPSDPMPPGGEPAPGHLVFALEAIERKLDTVEMTLERALAAL
jgi:hypothetical protein